MFDNFTEICKDTFDYSQKTYECARRQTIESYFNEFCILEGFRDFSYELGELLDSYIPKPEKPYLQFALLRIHEKSIKLYREATILMENGSASGAMARWRSLYEFSVIATILDKYPDLAYKYIEHSKIDNYKFAKKLVIYKDRLNIPDYNLEGYSHLEDEFNKITVKYDWDGKNNYEWAKNADIKNPNLFELAKNTQMEHLYAYVDEAHMYNHPSTRYLLNERGAKAPDDENNTYMFSPFEMELPLQLIVISLHQINIVTIKVYSDLDTANQEQLLQFLELNHEFPKRMIELIKERDNCKNRN